MRPRKQFGQHWLRSDRALEQIVAAAALQPEDCVLEIGAGTGILTERLLPLAPVVAVEVDRDLCKTLVQKFRSAENLLIIEGDILSLDLTHYLTQFSPGHPNKVVANIPYYITGAILELLLGTIAQPNPTPFDSLVLLVQKEVGDRLCAKPGNRTFGALSVRVQYLASCESICFVPAKAFYPPPKVDSVVIRVTPRPFLPLVDDPKILETLVKLGFGSKRKMLHNNLKPQLESHQLMPILETLGINPHARAEALGVADWVNLSNHIGASLVDTLDPKDANP